jgi:serine/threonine protein kinase
MRACPVCGRLYPEADFCQADGQRLGTLSQSPPRTDESDPRVGQLLLDRYLVFRVVADGGMGRVYEALDQQAQRQVALKVLHAEVGQDDVSVQRFKREYEVSSQLSHAHIVEVLDFKPARDSSYVLVMEFLAGETLRAALKRLSVLSLGRTVRLVSQLALALDPAHARDLVHRDLKPENVFLCQTVEGDVVKVLDFGSVKQLGSGRQLTMLGTTIGSPFYMSPEQAQGLASLDGRADVWAVTALVYESITGQLPFLGTNAPSILLSILSADPIPPSQLRTELPRSVDLCLARGFDKDPAHRTASVGELADAFGRALGLEGDHHAWSQWRESELDTKLAGHLPKPDADPSAVFFLRQPDPAAAPVDERPKVNLFVWALCALLAGALAAAGYLATQ